MVSLSGLASSQWHRPPAPKKKPERLFFRGKKPFFFFTFAAYSSNQPEPMKKGKIGFLTSELAGVALPRRGLMWLAPPPLFFMPGGWFGACRPETSIAKKRGRMWSTWAISWSTSDPHAPPLHLPPTPFLRSGRPLLLSTGCEGLFPFCPSVQEPGVTVL